MRKFNWIVAGILLLALATAPAFALSYKLIHFNESTGTGTVIVIDDDGVQWRLRFRDNPRGTPGQFDPGLDYVTAVRREG